MEFRSSVILAPFQVSYTPVSLEAAVLDRTGIHDWKQCAKLREVGRLSGSYFIIAVLSTTSSIFSILTF